MKQQKKKNKDKERKERKKINIKIIHVFDVISVLLQRRLIAVYI